MRFSVTPTSQNALFRRVRFSSPAQTSRHLTENRILSPHPHGKPHSESAPSRKGAFYGRRGLQNATLVTTLPQTALFREPQEPECAFP